MCAQSFVRQILRVTLEGVDVIEVEIRFGRMNITLASNQALRDSHDKRPFSEMDERLLDWLSLSATLGVVSALTDSRRFECSGRGSSQAQIRKGLQFPLGAFVFVA
ncbi:hypothetical protein PSP6_690048 [Paraburkholderia tropica]|nr:hypothetical protein PSP6_690048 [Paraburkholderia tropica]